MPKLIVPHHVLGRKKSLGRYRMYPWPQETTEVTLRASSCLSSPLGSNIAQVVENWSSS